MNASGVKYWHIAYVVPGREKDFAKELVAEGIVCFFPIKLMWNLEKAKKKAAVLFPGYVFFHGSNAEKFFICNSVKKWSGYLYTIMSEDKGSDIYYMLDNQIMLDLINQQMNGSFDFTKQGLIGIIRVGNQVIHDIPVTEPNYLKGFGTVLERNRKTATIMWENRVVKISLCFLKIRSEKHSPSESE